jgi:hypothetical protein
MLSHRSFCSVVLYIVCLYYHLMVRIASIKPQIDNSFFFQCGQLTRLTTMKIFRK